MLLAAALLPGETRIDLAACEPHVQDLQRLLSTMGAHIEGMGTHTVFVRGKTTLQGVCHRVAPDYLEAGVFVIAGLVWLSFTKQSSLLTQLNSLLLVQFGTLATFFLPFPFIVGGLMLTKIRSALSEPNVFVGSFIVLAALAGISRGGSVGSQLWSGTSSFLSPFFWPVLLSVL